MKTDEGVPGDRPPGGGQDEVTVEGMGAGGVGVANLSDGRIVFVPRTAPGDRARIRLTRDRERWARGEVVELLEKGEGRRAAPCPLYHRCGGCSLQHLAYREQLRWKGRIVGDALRRIGGREVGDPPVEPSPRELRYRTRMTFTLRRLRGGRVVAGLHHRLKRGRVLDVAGECLLPREALLQGWERLRDGWGRGAAHLPGGRELRLTLRVGRTPGSGEEALALLVTGGRGLGDPEALLARVPGLASVWREEEEGARHVAGDPVLEVPWLGREVAVPGGAFLQVNREAGQTLHRYVLAQASPAADRRVVEGYAGMGMLGRALAEAGARVVAVEEDPQAAKAGRRGGVEGFRLVQGRLEEALEGLLPADLVLVNPPRSGVHENVPRQLRARPPGELIYVSCDPATLARDLKRLGEGFGLRSVRSFDLFPQTGHVETVVHLERAVEPLTTEET